MKTNTATTGGVFMMMKKMAVGGIIGMFVSVPICSVIYVLGKEEVRRRLTAKKVVSASSDTESEEENLNKQK